MIGTKALRSLSDPRLRPSLPTEHVTVRCDTGRAELSNSKVLLSRDGFDVTTVDSTGAPILLKVEHPSGRGGTETLPPARHGQVFTYPPGLFELLCLDEHGDRLTSAAPRVLNLLDPEGARHPS